MTAVPNPQPSLADVIDRLDRLDRKLDTMDLETRARHAELSLSLSMSLQDIMRRLDTLFSELASFRREYNEHRHED